MELSTKEKQRLLNSYGPWAVVTGATSGIGQELARLLASAGFNLVLCGRRQEKLLEIEQEFTALYHGTIRSLAADLSELQGLEKLFQLTNELPIGLLVVSAGMGTSGEFLNSSIDEELRMLKINCETLLRLTHQFGQRFAQQQSGGIILLSSMVAFQGTPFAAHYAATKAYVQTLAEGLAVELKHKGVDVLAAAPGPVSSEFGARANMIMKGAMTPAQVGVPIMQALGRTTTVLPGMLTKLLVYSLRTVPRWGKIKIMEKVMGGMTAHQRKP
ncbi:SDR family NAD(P)-dependent oxidoreductase [Arundinibacter roseus]|uniref:SDR family NAD(P)-dependent oxidoreductase n=1 Tax=Arundinibacter roseus TaxID=2070510 RepID=A0A4R4KGP0_9BACT|nr:SDR family NAD(P)-dependent oxidoreductase [Arundinibacter roseus]TDB66883.1 SDR family NAD(P)-dependent oxidoreductase [Arundinibacter roseus]